ncbi:MAG: transcriptional regulator [Burkholderiales bacterium PBB5]|nr:MAG: transcriptional regulator [Burkholderiales bacterium PBB5]
MSSPDDVLRVLRAHLRAAQVTYRQLAERLALSESSIKRAFSQKDMTLSRLAQICQAAGLSMEDVLRDAADQAQHPDMLSLAQEASLVADPRLLLVAICCLGQWSLAQITGTYQLTEAECIGCLARLDRLGLIVLRPDNSYRRQVSLAFRWRADGPAQQFLRQHVVADYFSGGFGDEGEAVLCMPARLSPASAVEMVGKVRQLAADLARLQQRDQRDRLADIDGYTLLLGFRCWEFSAFTALRRAASPQAQPTHHTGPRKR